MRAFAMVTDFCQKNNIDINTEKTAYTTNDAVHNDIIDPKSGLPIVKLLHSSSYNYLGWWINVDLNWKKIEEEISEKYKKVVRMILRKRYMQTNIHIKLVNAAAIPIISYRMSVLPLQKSFITALDTWTVHQFHRTTNIPRNTGRDFFWLFRGLQRLEHLNIAIPATSVTSDYNEFFYEETMNEYIQNLNHELNNIDLHLQNPDSALELNDINFQDAKTLLHPYEKIILPTLLIYTRKIQKHPSKT